MKTRLSGLDKPAASITFFGESQWKIQMGAKNATSTGIFAESSKESGEVLLLDSSYAEQFTRDMSHYYDLRLFPLQPEAVTRVQLDMAEGAGWEINVKDGKASFIAPADLTNKKVSRTELDGYLRDMSGLKGTDFVLGKSAPQGEPAATLRIWKNGSKDPVEVRFYETSATADKNQQDVQAPSDPGLVAVSSWQNAPLVMEAAARAKIFRPAFSLRDRSVLEMAPGQVERQVVKREATGDLPAAQLIAAKSESGWTVDGKERQGLDMLLWRLSDLQYEDEPQDSLPQGAQKELVWELYGEKQALLHTLVFYRPSGSAGGKSDQWIAVDDKAPYYPVSSKLADDLAALLPAAAGSAKSAPEATQQPVTTQ